VSRRPSARPIIFLVARSACGESLVRRAGPLACKLADGFRAMRSAISCFCGWCRRFRSFLVNLVPALVGVKLRRSFAATAIGRLPATFAFAFFGSGLDSVIAAQERLYRACRRSGRTDCHVHSTRHDRTPQLLLRLRRSARSR
jgi:uncharacterized membrane protein YdjX (TVP38/TMEM64 family)